MKPEYKLRQEMYNNLYQIDDRIGLDGHPWAYCIDDDERLVADILEYFTIEISHVLLYPSKSYAVAVIYAKLLNKYFGIPVLEALKDPHLLYDNDRFFVPYRAGGSADIYNRVLLQPINWDLPQVKTTVNYFMEEFLLVPNPYFDNSNIINTKNN